MTEHHKKRTKRTNFWLGFFIGLAVVSLLCFLGLLIFIFSQSEPVNLAEQVQAEDTKTDPNPMQDESEEPSAVPPISESDHVQGPKDAKVVLIEYSDFECPYCFRHYLTMKQIEEEYKDKIAVVFRHFPLSFHANAQKAAEAAECAGEQGKFWEMHDKLFEANANEELNLDKFKQISKDLGLNTDQFNDCLDNEKMASKVAKDMAGGQKAGVSGTPATFINGELVSGALPLDQFKVVIDQLLSE